MRPPTLSLVLIVAAMVAADPAIAQVKLKRCLTQSEVLTEQLVRHGIFLREGGNRCDEYKPGTATLWKDFDAKFGQRFAQQTAKRHKMFEREFKGKATEVVTYFDGRLVTYYRHYPLGVAYCENVDKLLKDATKKGWGGFTKQAQTIQNEVILDYKVCQ
jgi:hypothetical protein